MSYTGGSASGSTAVRISEPSVTITKAVSPTSNVQAGDTLTYTVTVSNATGRADAFDLVLNDALGNLGRNFDLQSVSLPGTLPPGTASIVDNSITNGSSAATGDRIQLQIDRLNAGQSFSFTYTGVVLTVVQPGTTLTNTANITYTGLPGTGTPNGSGGNSTGSTTPGSSGSGTGERDGSGGVNTYSKNASRSVVSQAVGAIKSTRLTSEAHTTGNGVTIGEIVRFRLQESLPQGTLINSTVLDTLPTGLTFLADNTATLAFVASKPDELRWSLGSITPYYLVSVGNNNTVIPTASFAPTVSGQSLSWDLGEIINLNKKPDEIESVIIEFNAIVANVASNQAGVTLTNSFIASAGLSGSTVQTTSNATPLSVLEPNLQTDKSVAIIKTGIAGNPNATPGDTLLYKVSIVNTGTAKAFDLVIDDNLDALGINFDLLGPHHHPEPAWSAAGGRQLDLQRQRRPGGPDPGAGAGAGRQPDDHAHLPGGAGLEPAARNLSDQHRQGHLHQHARHRHPQRHRWQRHRQHHPWGLRSRQRGAQWQRRCWEAERLPQQQDPDPGGQPAPWR